MELKYAKITKKVKSKSAHAEKNPCQKFSNSDVIRVYISPIKSASPTSIQTDICSTSNCISRNVNVSDFSSSSSKWSQKEKMSYIRISARSSPQLKLAAGRRQFVIPPFQVYQLAFLASRISLVEGLRPRRSARPFPIVLYSFNVWLLNTWKNLQWKVSLERSFYRKIWTWNYCSNNF